MEAGMTWAKWIAALLFGCVHRHTTWPQRKRTGLDYICCLDCGREFPYSIEFMRVLSEEKQAKNRSRYRWARIKIHPQPAALLPATSPRRTS
jgi:hypothetical protein